jgi:hypothetical protein
MKKKSKTQEEEFYDDLMRLESKLEKLNRKETRFEKSLSEYDYLDP